MAVQYLVDRIKSKSRELESGCWEWLGWTGSNGYGMSSFGSRTTGDLQGTTAHRVSYMAFVGDIPEGYHIDHLCKVRNCVNPDHLEAVTPKENVARSDAIFKKLMARTHCPQNHEYTEDNMYTYKTKWGGRTRNCKTCMKERSRMRRRVAVGVA